MGRVLRRSSSTVHVKKNLIECDNTPYVHKYITRMSYIYLYILAVYICVIQYVPVYIYEYTSSVTIYRVQWYAYIICAHVYMNIM